MQKVRDTRKRLFWAASILFAALVVHAALSPAPEDRGGIIQNELSRLFRPFASAVTWVSSGISSVWHHYLYLTHASVENDQLHRDVAGLREQVLALQEEQVENQRLRSLLNLSESWRQNPIAARVIAASTHHDIHTIVIDRGWADGIERDRPVMADGSLAGGSPAGGLIGRVRVITEHTSTVLLITDPNSSVDVMDVRSRVRGLLVGALKDTELHRPVALTQLEYVSQDSDIQQGDALVTSGMDGVYPKGLPVGRVHVLRKDAFGLFEEALVLPAADLSRLEEVIVL